MIGQCKVDFIDSEGHNCMEYVELRWCKPNGDYGENWNPYGTWKLKLFSDYEKDGFDATDCPECGCAGKRLITYLKSKQ